MKKLCVWIVVLLIILVGIKQCKKHRQSHKVWRINSSEVLEDISKAKEMLSEKKVGNHNDVLLAIRHRSNDIEVIRLRNGTTPPKGFEVIFPRRLNGVNTAYEILSPQECTVLALKRVVRASNGFQEVVYTPYTKGIDRSEFRKEGLAYLKDKLEKAEDELRDKRIRSLAYGGLVADAIPKDVALTLAIIEHIDPARFRANDPIDVLVNEVLIVLAANRECAYRYSVSKTGARGQFQFMPRTYRGVDQRYPKAELIDDFVAGTDNHANAAKATLLLFDSDLSYLSKTHRKFLKKHPEAMGKYLAAAYNGGPKRALDAIRQYTWTWESHVLPETRTYLEEFEAVWKFLRS